MLEASNHAGWRLPQVKELASLLDPSQPAQPYVDLQIFPLSGVWFWTSSPGPGAALQGRAWVVKFVDGFIPGDGYGVDLCDRKDTYAVRLVR